MMRIFKNTWFNRFARKEGITDAELREAANLLEAGQADAKIDLSLTEEQLNNYLRKGILIEVI